MRNAPVQKLLDKLSINETQDCEEWFIKNIIVTSLNKSKQSTPYILVVEQFETTNSSAVSNFVLSIP
jgi:hypothetical protein